MTGAGRQQNSLPDRVAAALVMPFVLLWDGGRALMFGFFGLLERLDPFAFSWRVLKRLAPPIIRLWRAVLPTLVRIRDTLRSWLAVVFGWVAEKLGPLVRRLTPVLDFVDRQLRRLVRSVVAVVRRALSQVRKAVAPAVRTVRAVWQTATAPVRRLVAMVRNRMTLARAWLGRIRSRD